MNNLLHARRFCVFSFLSVSAFLLFGLCVPRAVGQSETASVSGRVTDPSNAVVVDAQVEVRNTVTGAIASTKTNGDGIYVVPSLKPGEYVMSVSKDGFRSVSVTSVTLGVQDVLVRNFVLQIGSSAESVTVVAEGVVI